MNKDERWLLVEKYEGVESIAFHEDCKRLLDGEPLAYVIGHIPFLGLSIDLTSKPLIPRPETEWWVDKLIQHLQKSIPVDDSMKFLDLCSGSGAIGCSALNRLPNAVVYFGEIEPNHETAIRKNISCNDLDASRAHIGIGDLFAPFSNQKFDVIAVNPPYVPTGRILDASVINYEPHSALFSGVDGLAIIRRIAQSLPNNLAEGGEAWIECDEKHADEACVLFTEAGYYAKTLQDQYSAPRVVVVS